MTMYVCVEYSNAGSAPLEGSVPICLGDHTDESQAIAEACSRLGASVRFRSILQRDKQRWVVLSSDELDDCLSIKEFDDVIG